MILKQILPLLILLCMDVAVSASSHLLDLSKDLKEAKHINKSTGYNTLLESISSKPYIRTALVLEHGKIVASYTREDVDASSPANLFSVTKSIVSLLIGILIDDGLLQLDTTLGDVFPEEELWTNVTNIDERKNITIQEILTMTTGISGISNENWFVYLKPCGGQNIYEVLQEGLLVPAQKGVFDYIPTSKLLSHVIVKVSNQTPRQLLRDRILIPLGIDDSGIEWKLNPYQNPYTPYEADPTFPFGIPCQTGPEPWSSSMYLTVHQMAKIGQLVLQKGAASDVSQIISTFYIQQAFTSFVNTTGLLENGEYGFFWYKLQNLPGFQVTETMQCAYGAYNQFICIDDELDRVSVQQADLTGIIPSSLAQDSSTNSTVTVSESVDSSEALVRLDPSEPVFLAMNPLVSFDKMENNNKKKKSKSHKSSSIRGSKSESDKSWEYPSESKSQD